MTREEFDDEMSRLIDLKLPPSSLDGHWDALYDVPLHMLKAGVTHALRTRAWFPTGAELRADVDANMPRLEPDERERLTLLHEPHVYTLPTGNQVTVTREWRYDCLACSDTGWQSFWCGERGPSMQPWLEFRACGWHHGHAGHEFVGACPCAATNPTIQRRKAAQAKYAKAPEKVSA